MNEGQLVVVESLNPVSVFTGPEGVERIIKDIEDKCSEFVPNTETATGRKEIASMAYKVSQSKTLLDGLGKDLVSDWKEKAKVVDASRKTLRDRLDALRDQVRKPLTDWEAEEKARVEEMDRKNKLLLDEAEAWHMHGLWLREQAIAEKEAEIAREEQAKRQAEEERKSKELEQQRLAEAKEQAKREAEEAAAQKIREAEEAAKRAEQQRIEAAERAEREKAEAVRMAMEEAEREAKRLKEQQERELHLLEEEEERRKADVENRRRVNREAVDAMMKLSGVTEDVARAVVLFIAKGMIPNVTIKY